MMHCRFAWVCMCIRSLHNAILCLCMYICNACTIQSYAHVCISVTLAQLLCDLVAKMCPWGRLWPRITAWPAWPVSFLWKNTTTSFQVPVPLTTHYGLQRQAGVPVCTAGVREVLLKPGSCILMYALV